MTRRLLTERGLSIKLSDLYDTLQDCLGENFLDLIKSTVLEPGLRIAEGDEFLVHQVGHTLQAKAGAVVFPDYDIFVPVSTSADMSMSLEDVTGINEPGSRFGVYVTATTDLSHPYPQVGTAEAFYTIRQNAIKILMLSALGVPPANSYLLAIVEVQDDGSLEIEDRRMDSVLKIVSKYARSDWQAAEVPTKPANVNAVVVNMEDYRHGGAHGHSFNRQSVPINRRIGPAIEVTWDAPTPQALDAINGVMYYKVVATPRYNSQFVPEAALEQVVIIDRIAIENAEIPQKRIGCLIPCDPCGNYKVEVYRVSDILDMKISDASDPEYVIAGSSVAVALDRIELNLAYTLHSTDFVKITSSVEPTANTTIQVFAYEYSGSPPSSINDLRYLFYEGPVQDLLYRIQDKTLDGVSILYKVRGKRSQFLYSAQEELEFETLVSEVEHLVYFCVPASDTGWPGRDLPNDEVVGANAEADLTNCTVTITAPDLPHNRRVGDWIYITNCAGMAANVPNGAYEITEISDTDVTIDISGAAGPPSGNGTLDVPGNAQIQNLTNPAKLTIPASSHLQGLFAAGNYAVIGNSSIPGTLADGTYTVTSVDTANEIWLDDNTGPAGAGYCDVVAPEEITLHTFTLDEDMILSRVRITGYQGQVLHADDTEHGNIATYIISTTAAGDQEINVPRSGGAYKEFQTTDPIPAGATITLKLKRGSDNLIGIDASRYHVFMYFKRAI
jgi:hypothetical protein